MTVIEFIKRVEALTYDKQQLVLAQMFGVLKALDRLDILEEILKEYED